MIITQAQSLENVTRPLLRPLSRPLSELDYKDEDTLPHVTHQSNFRVFDKVFQISHQCLLVQERRCELLAMH